jgi:hypothetical protein
MLYIYFISRVLPKVHCICMGTFTTGLDFGFELSNLRSLATVNGIRVSAESDILSNATIYAHLLNSFYTV